DGPLLVHTTVSPTPMLTDFGLNAKSAMLTLLVAARAGPATETVTTNAMAAVATKAKDPRCKADLLPLGSPRRAPRPGPRKAHPTLRPSPGGGFGPTTGFYTHVRGAGRAAAARSGPFGGRWRVEESPDSAVQGAG